jgi:hypothetical protein
MQQPRATNTRLSVPARSLPRKEMGKTANKDRKIKGSSGKRSNNHEMKSAVEAVNMTNKIRTARSYYMDLFVVLESFRYYLSTEKKGTLAP